MKNLTYSNAKKSFHLSLLGDDMPEAMKWLTVMQEKAEGDEEKEEELEEIMAAIALEDTERLEELVA